MIRTFIAVDVGEACRCALQKAVETLALEDYPIRWSGPHLMHITLKFLGDTDPKRAPEVCQIMREAIQGVEPFTVHVAGLSGLPERRPRVVVVEVEDPEGQLTRIHQYLNRELAARLRVEKEERGFSPHITIGRSRQRVSNFDPTDMARRARCTDFGLVHVDAIQLMSSELTPKGPIYAVMDTARLG